MNHLVGFNIATRPKPSSKAQSKTSKKIITEPIKNQVVGTFLAVLTAVQHLILSRQPDPR